MKDSVSAENKKASQLVKKDLGNYCKRGMDDYDWLLMISMIMLKTQMSFPPYPIRSHRSRADKIVLN